MYLCLILLNATIIFISPNPESSPSLLPGRGQLIMDGSPSCGKRRKREAEEKNCPSVQGPSTQIDAFQTNIFS